MFTCRGFCRLVSNQTVFLRASGLLPSSGWSLLKFTTLRSVQDRIARTTLAEPLALVHVAVPLVGEMLTAESAHEGTLGLVCLQVHQNVIQLAELLVASRAGEHLVHTAGLFVDNVLLSVALKLFYTLICFIQFLELRLVLLLELRAISF